jgi:hypothetical protein
MPFFGKKVNRDINYLELTPVRKYEHNIKPDGLIDVLVPRFSDKILGKLLQPKLKRPYIRANLDEIGTAAWLEIDGNNKVNDIIQNLQLTMGEKIHPAQQRITLFLSNLYRNGFIYFKEFIKEN